MPRFGRQGRVLCLGAAILLGWARPLAAQSAAHATNGARTFPAVVETGMEVPVIDGRVNEAVWQRTPAMADFTQQDPNEGAASSERTEVRLLFTATHVYVGVICFDRDPSSIIVSPSRRDSSLADTDSIILVFDTFDDRQNAFVFGTSAAGIEYDGQVAHEGQTSGITNVGTTSLAASVASGNSRGTISAFNPNWDGDWTVKAQVTERGWEAEMAIPLRTLRYPGGSNLTWGFNVMRNIRHKNEQAFLSPIARGFDIYRVSDAARITGVTLPALRDMKLIPYALGSFDQITSAAGSTNRRARAGGDLKWAVRQGLTLDATVNTDFAQVEADDQQLNLTRFDLFFPEKRPFFLENASTFQFGQPQAIDLFFSRRIGLSSSGRPIDIVAGSRLSGTLGGWNVGLLDVQTADTHDAAGQRLAPPMNVSVLRAQKEVNRSTYGAIFIGRDTTDADTAGATKWNRAYGVDADVQLSRTQRLSAFFARTDSPETAATPGSDYAGRAFYAFTNNLFQVSGGLAQVGDRFNPEVGFLPRRGFRRPDLRAVLNYQPKSVPWIRRFSPHTTVYTYYGLDGKVQSSSAHFHVFEIQPARGGRFGFFTDRYQDRPLTAFTVYDRDGRKVTIPAGFYTWWQQAVEYIHNPSAPVTVNARVRVGHYYDGDFTQLELTNDYRFGTRLAATLGWTRQRASLPGGTFVTYLVPVKASYAFTPHASLSALVQYNGQTAQISSNIRLALLNRSGTGLFVVYNDKRNRTDFPATDPPGRSFVVKFTRLFDLLLH